MPEQDKAHPAVTIIIPNYNGANLLRKNLPAVQLAASTYPGDCHVIVVDDASTDDSVLTLGREFAGVETVCHDINRGFAESIHSGVRAARTDCLIFLNSDVRPDADFMAPLMEHLQQPDIFSVTPLVLDGAGQITEEAWRCYEIRRGRLRLVRRKEYVPSTFVETLFASGGSCALRKDRFLALGGFASIFKPFYCEDTDLGLRAWKQGWRSLFEPNSRVIHDHVGSSINANVPSARIRRTRRRNQFLLEWIHLPSADIFRKLLPGYVLQALGRMLRLDLVYLGGLIAALQRMPEVRRLRTEIGTTQIISFADIMDSIQASAQSGHDVKDQS